MLRGRRWRDGTLSRQKGFYASRRSVTLESLIPVSSRNTESPPVGARPMEPVLTHGPPLSGVSRRQLAVPPRSTCGGRWREGRQAGGGCCEGSAVSGVPRSLGVQWEPVITDERNTD